MSDNYTPILDDETQNKDTKQCEYCYAEINAKATICPYCRKSQPLKSIPSGKKKNCKYCMEAIDKSAKVCPRCGKSQGNIVISIFSIIGALFLLSIVLKSCMSYNNQKGSIGSLSMTKKNNSSVTVTDYYIAKDYIGDEVLVIEYDFYNGSSDTRMFMTTFSASCFQHGVEVQSSYFKVEGVQDDGGLAEVQPGATAHLASSYKLKDHSQVNFVVTNFGGDTKYVDLTITLKED